MSDVVNRRGLTILGIGAMLVAVALLAWQMAPEKASAQSPIGGMGLEIVGGDCDASGCSVAPGAPFQVAVTSTVLPVPVSGFGAEVVFGGLTYTPAACADQVQVSPEAICASLLGPAGQARLAVGSGVVPPLTALDATEGGTLALLDATCADSGTFPIYLTALTLDATSAPFGAVYFDLSPLEVYVATSGTASLDLENSGSPTDVALADSIDVTCEMLAPTDTPISGPPDVEPTIVSTGSGGSDGSGGAGAPWLLVGAGVLLVIVLSGAGLQRWRSSREA